MRRIIFFSLMILAAPAVGNTVSYLHDTTAPAAAPRPKVAATPVIGTLKVPDKRAAAAPAAARAAQTPDVRRAKPAVGVKTLVKTIVIDAGHGGQDPGAIGVGAVREKDITLAVAHRVADALAATGKYRVIFTRADDTFIPLGTRVKIARAAKADLFVSLHADIAAEDDTARGASIYTISDQASDALSARLAAHENKADLLGPTLPNNVDAEIGNILVDFMTHETMDESKTLSSAMVKTFAQRGIRTIAHPQRAAGFAVLKAPDIPSILIEMGFLSSDDEVQMLASGKYQQQLAQSIAAGVGRYFATDNAALKD